MNTTTLRKPAISGDHSLVRKDTATSALSIAFVWHDAIDALRAEWLELEASAANPLPFTGYDFLRHWRAVFCTGDSACRPLVVTVRDNDRLVAVLPLTVSCLGPVNICEWMGEPLTEYGDALLRRGYPARRWLAPAVECLRHLPDADVLFLRKVRADATIANLLSQSMSAAGPAREAAVVDLRSATGIETLHRALSSNFRKELRRKRKRLASVGKLDFAVAGAGPVAAAATERAIAFKREWLNAHGKTSRAFSDPRSFTVLNRLAADESAGHGLVASELSLDQIPVATEVGFRAGAHYYAYLGSYNPEFAQYGPGVVQMEDTIAWCIEQGIDSCDLFAPADGYKLRWTKDTVEVNDFVATRGIVGRVYGAWLARLRPRLKQVHDAIPPRLRMLALHSPVA